MRSDDILEWLAAACLVAAGYLIGSGEPGRLFHGLRVALLIAGVCLIYFAQCYDAPIPKLRHKLRLLRSKRGTDSQGAGQAR